MELTEPTRWSGYRCELGEGIRWTGERLVHVDVLSGRLFGLDPAESGEGQADVLAAVDFPLGAVAPRRNGSGTWIAAVGTGIAVLTEPGTLQWIGAVTDDSVTPTRVNDGGCDPAGRFWVSTMAYDNTVGAGELHRLDPDGTITQVLTGLTVPNGPAWSPDGETMYLASSTEGRIDAYTVDSTDGSLGAGRQFAQLDAGLSPDGMTVDDEGYLWAAIWDGAAVYRFTPDGDLDRTIALPTSRPTSCWFGGPDRARLFVTTATYGLDDDEAAGWVYAIDVGVTGPPAAAFVG
jgi:sugar lactone lactonase YvrE